MKTLLLELMIIETGDGKLWNDDGIVLDDIIVDDDDYGMMTIYCVLLCID